VQTRSRPPGGGTREVSRPAGKATKGRRPLVLDGVEIHCTARYEDEARLEGFLVVAGLDEVGCGALCGPVIAGAAILGERFDTRGLDDSKRLTERQRRRMDERIRTHAVAFALGVAEVDEIDRLNILRATHLAMRRALLALPVKPDLVLVDGRPVGVLGVSERAIVKGDALSVSIAAASIVAKVARDGIMRECDLRYPGYGLAHNVGYASEAHRDALRRLGPSAIHRRSFAGMMQASLF
jgi:ribonuclease HII